MYALSDCHCSLLSAFSVATSPPKDSHNPTALSLAHHDIDHFDGSKQTQSGSLLTENALISEPRTSTIDAIDGSAYSADPDHSYHLGAASMVMGFTLFTTVFLFGSASSAIVVVATHFLVFFNTFKNLVPLI